MTPSAHVYRHCQSAFLGKRSNQLAQFLIKLLRLECFWYRNDKMGSSHAQLFAIHSLIYFSNTILPSVRLCKRYAFLLQFSIIFIQSLLNHSQIVVLISS